MWKVEPSPGACPICLEFSRKTYAEKPNLPHPNCKCRISRQEKKKRYYVIGRRPLDGFEPISTTQLDWIKKWDKNAYKSRDQKKNVSLSFFHKKETVKFNNIIPK